MSRSLKSALSVLSILLFLFSVLAHAESYPQIGRRATVAEIAAWDIDIRPDFRGLPAGSGSVTQGMRLWEAKCASCHGAFGESPAVFPPLVGGTTKEDSERGRVAGLWAATENAKTTMMKLATVSTLWDYIRRAMPFDAPKSLSVNEVYAATAYLLNLADLVPADFTLTEKNIREVQAKMPNRAGMTLNHGMREISGKPDVTSQACMSACTVDETSLVVLPPSGRGLNGNLAEQNRGWGSVRGVDTSGRK
jgi:cytochrome c